MEGIRVRGKNARRGLGLVRKEKGELETSGRILTNRAMFDYFRGSNIVKNHTLNNVIAQNCPSVDFIKKVDYSEPDVFQDEFDRFLRAINEFLDTETQGGNLVSGRL